VRRAPCADSSFGRDSPGDRRTSGNDEISPFHHLPQGIEQGIYFMNISNVGNRANTDIERGVSQMGPRRTSAEVTGMSAYTSKADLSQTPQHVGVCAKTRHRDYFLLANKDQATKTEEATV
jgi:hypothetical protein